MSKTNYRAPEIASPLKLEGWALYFSQVVSDALARIGTDRQAQHHLLARICDLAARGGSAAKAEAPTLVETLDQVRFPRKVLSEFF